MAGQHALVTLWALLLLLHGTRCGATDSARPGASPHVARVSSPRVGPGFTSPRVGPGLGSDPAETNASTAALLSCRHLPAGSDSGVYMLRLAAEAAFSRVQAYCDMSTDGGGWTLLMRRHHEAASGTPSVSRGTSSVSRGTPSVSNGTPSVSFDRTWSEYSGGFGSLTGEFWWGLEKLSLATARGDVTYELRVDLRNAEGDTAYAVYQNFSVSPESDGYRLSGGRYSGTAGESLAYHFGQRFSTRDRDQDDWAGNCAGVLQGGWWYKECSWTHLTGETAVRGFQWFPWARSLKQAEMKIRLVNV